MSNKCNDNNVTRQIVIQDNITGRNGLSAYEIAIKEGKIPYDWTEDQFIDYLKGETGPQGIQGIPGVSITDIDKVNDELIISKSNGESINLGNVKGNKGDKGDIGDGLKIDASGTLANRPSTAPINSTYLVTDTGILTVYTTSGWSSVSTTTGTTTLNPDGTAVPQEKAVAQYVEPIFKITKLGSNFANTLSFVAGGLALDGSYQNTNNGIRINYTKVPQELKGETIAISGFGVVTTSQALLIIKDSSGNVIQTLAGQGSGGVGVTRTLLLSSNADTWAMHVATDSTNGGIGTRPKDNPFVTSLMVNKGSISLPFEPYGRLIDHEKIDNPDLIKYTNTISKEGEGAVPAKEIYSIKNKLDEITIPSRNLIDTSSDIVRGYWRQLGITNDSVNWIRTKIMLLPESVIQDVENGEERYLTLSGGGTIPSADGAILVTFNENNEVVDIYPGTNTTSFPFTIQIKPEWRSFGATVANQATDGGIGSRPTNNDYTNTFQVEIGEVPTPYQSKDDYSINPDKLPSFDKYDLSEIVLKKVTNTLFHIFFHIGGSSDIWFRINLRHQINASKFVDIWRIEEGWRVLRNGDNFTNIQQVINEGVYENAMYTSGAGYSDALGSAHGWETLDEFNIFMDGKALDIEDSSFIEIKGYNLMFTTSTYFKTPDGNSNIGKSLKIWNFRNGIFNIKNQIQWLGTLNFSANTYVSMCSVLRKGFDDSQITHSAMSNEELKTYDVSEAGFTTPIYTNDSDKRRNLLIVWGDTFKAEMEMKNRSAVLADGTIIPNGFTGCGMRVQNTNTPRYNKEYGKMGATTVQNGDTWNIETEYRLSNI